jgi:hypothetical protein
MTGGPSSTEPKKPAQPMGAQGIVFAVVGAACGIFTAARLAAIFPLWGAVLIALVLWVVLVASMTASCGSELLDIAVGSVTIIIVMTLVVEAGVRAWQRRHPKTPPAAANHAASGNGAMASLFQDVRLNRAVPEPPRWAA